MSFYLFFCLVDSFILSEREFLKGLAYLKFPSPYSLQCAAHEGTLLELQMRSCKSIGSVSVLSASSVVCGGCVVWQEAIGSGRNECIRDVMEGRNREVRSLRAQVPLLLARLQEAPDFYVEMRYPLPPLLAATLSGPLRLPQSLGNPCSSRNNCVDDDAIPPHPPLPELFLFYFFPIPQKFLNN